MLGYNIKNILHIVKSEKHFVSNICRQKGKTMENNRNRTPGNNGDQNNQKKNRIAIIVITLIFALLFTTMSSYFFDSMTKKEITYDVFISLLDSGQVESVTFDSNKIYITPKTENNALIKTTFWTTQLNDPELIND